MVWQKQPQYSGPRSQGGSAAAAAAAPPTSPPTHGITGTVINTLCVSPAESSIMPPESWNAFNRQPSKHWFRRAASVSASRDSLAACTWAVMAGDDAVSPPGAGCPARTTTSWTVLPAPSEPGPAESLHPARHFSQKNVAAGGLPATAIW